MVLPTDSTTPLFFATTIVGLLITALILFVVLYRKAQLRFQLERQQFKQTLLESEVEIKSETLRSISRELHDNFGQVISLAKLQLNSISISQANEAEAQVGETSKLLTKLLDEMRDLSLALNQNQFEDVALPWLIEKDLKRIENTGIFMLNYKLDKPTNLNAKDKLSLYRIFQELINNALKHSQAQNLWVRLINNNEELRLSVKDDGIGFRNDNTTLGQGLKNLKERITAFGGDFYINGEKGTEAVITLTNKYSEAHA